MLALVLCTCAAVTPEEKKDFGYLYEPAFQLDYELSGPVRPYQPQPADMFMSTDKMAIIQWGHKVCGANAPIIPASSFASRTVNIALWKRARTTV